MSDALLAVFVSAAFISALLTPAVAHFAVRGGLFDPPSPRKQHPERVPRLGGVGVLAAAITALTLAVRDPAVRALLVAEGSALLPLTIGSSIVCLAGFIDDVHPLGAIEKLLAQSIAAIVVIFFGVRIEAFQIMGDQVNLGVFAAPVTFVWIVALTNAFNLIDGLDGLATGIALISGSTSAILLVRRGHMDEAFILVALLGGAVGFFPYNFFGRRIFLGDGGSLLFGFVLSVTAVTAWQKGTTVLSLSAPLLMFALPLVEVSVSLSRRLVNGIRRAGWRGLFWVLIADEEHIHHRLVALGLTPRSVVLLLYTVSMGATLLALSMAGNAQ